jgi:hypothetical protein
MKLMLYKIHDVSYKQKHGKLKFKLHIPLKQGICRRNTDIIYLKYFNKEKADHLITMIR